MLLNPPLTLLPRHLSIFYFLLSACHFTWTQLPDTSLFPFLQPFSSLNSRTITSPISQKIPLVLSFLLYWQWFFFSLFSICVFFLPASCFLVWLLKMRPNWWLSSPTKLPKPFSLNCLLSYCCSVLPSLSPFFIHFHTFFFLLDHSFFTVLSFPHFFSNSYLFFIFLFFLTPSDHNSHFYL